MLGINRHICLQVIAITATATAFGLLWNRQLLMEVATGRGAATVKTTVAPPDAPVPLPLGLMQVKEFFDRQEAVFVDARDPETYRQGHIRGAVSLPVAATKPGNAPVLAGVPLSKTVVVYCNGFGCHDSNTVGAALIKAGYRTVYLFEGGYPEWQAAGYPLAGSQP